MSELSTKKRNSLPDSDFAGKGRSYPVEDKAHARDAKARASEEEHKGKLSAGEKKSIDRKADKVLGEEATPSLVIDSILTAEPAIAVEAFQSMVKDRARNMVLSQLAPISEKKDEDCDCDDDDDKNDKKKSKDKDKDDDDDDDKDDKKDFFKKKKKD